MRSVWMPEADGLLLQLGRRAALETSSLSPSQSGITS